MPESLHSQSSLLRIAKWSLVAIGVVAAIWVGVIMWWQSSQREITPGDVLVYLVILPLAVLAAAAGILWLRRRKNQASEAEPAGAAAAAKSAEQSQPGDSAANGLPVVAAWGITSAGSSLDEFRTALIERRQRPQPDAGLLDDYGFPLHTARIRDLDTSDIEDALENIAANNAGRTHGQDDTAREGFLRTLALLTRLLDQLGAEWPLAEENSENPTAAQSTAILRGSEPAGAQADTRLRLQVKLIMPADFSPAEQQQALTLLLERTAALPLDPQRMHVQVLTARDEPAALQLAERFRGEALHAAQPQALLLMACESDLCPTVVERWQNERRLFGSHAPQGLMPGEAAFAILCLNRKALPLALDTPACLLQRVALGRREASADDSGRPGHAALDAVLASALAAAAVSGDAIGAVACDADHRSSRILECIGAMLQQTPHLDAIENRLSVNEACGHTGAASNAGSWAAGIAQVRETGSPVLLFNVSHAFERAAAVLMPAGEQSQPS